jgi:hypothetical protein
MASSATIRWPRTLKHTRTRDRWFKHFAKLKPGLSLQRVSRQLKENYASVYRWAELFEYRFPDLRRSGRVSSSEWDKVDWSLRDADIARELGVSRERVRQVRADRRAGPSSHRALVHKFVGWCKSRRDKLHGQTVAAVVAKFGGGLSQQVARRIMRTVGVQPHDPGQRWREAEWRLPNRDLASIWDASPKYVANIRARLQVGHAKWDSRNGAAQDPRYLKALAGERKKAQQAKREERQQMKTK